MRLSTKEIEAIKRTFFSVFEKGKLYLFGSRVDDSRKGGDIDLYIVPDEKENLGEKRIEFLVLLKRAIGEQKIDVVIDRGENRPIDQTAKSHGVLICRG